MTETALLNSHGQRKVLNRPTRQSKINWGVRGFLLLWSSVRIVIDEYLKDKRHFSYLNLGSLLMTNAEGNAYYRNDVPLIGKLGGPRHCDIYASLILINDLQRPFRQIVLEDMQSDVVRKEWWNIRHNYWAGEITEITKPNGMAIT